MPTSATGADLRRHERGFTLVELMVVLVVLGLMTSVALVAVPRGPSLASEAETFAARLGRAQEEAVLTNRAIGVRVDSQGYAFRRRTGGVWSPLEDGPFKATAWSEGVVAALDTREPIGQVSFDGSGLAEPLSITLSREARSVRVSVDAAGNVRLGEPG
jgi:general secretion pathway protein H